MTPWLHTLAPIPVFAPLVAAVLLGLRALWTGLAPTERASTGWIGAGLAVALLGHLAVGALTWGSGVTELDYGTWIQVGAYEIPAVLRIDHVGAAFAVLSASLTAMVAWFSRTYLHKEPGFFRFYLLLGLFGTGTGLVATAGALDVMFAGWEMISLASALFIGFFHERPEPVRSALRAFATYRLCDVGFLLAMVTTPTLSEADGMTPERRRNEGADVNKPVEGVYPPGSIVKPLLFAGAVTQGAVPADLSVECKGHFFENVTTSARCWIWRPEEGRSSTHGPLQVEEAIARSCNIYFYTVASRLGLPSVVEWYRRYGVGSPLGVGLAYSTDREGGGIRIEGESGGALPDEAELGRIQAAGDRSAPVFLGIGQGPVAWTPAHAANAYATLARRGVVIRPGVFLDRTDRGQAHTNLHLAPIAVSKALEGLRQSVSERHGTGNHLTLEDGVQEPLTAVPGVHVWAKTGTAQAPPLKIDNNKDHVADVRVRTDHAWFVGLVGNEGEHRPRYALAVLLEYGGSGGKTAGPIAAEIIRALVREGYLSGRTAAGHAQGEGS